VETLVTVTVVAAGQVLPAGWVAPLRLLAGDGLTVGTVAPPTEVVFTTGLVEVW
jgi:hypothetical protein